MRGPVRHSELALAAVLFIFVLACVGRVEPKEIPTPRPPEPTAVPETLNLPEDDGSHDAPIEWWYYNGHLESDDGEEFSFHFVIFQTANEDRTDSFEVGQAGITDVGGVMHYYIASEGFGSSQVELLGLVDLDLGNISLEIDGRHFLEASDVDSGTGMRLRTEKPGSVMLHEDVGWMDWPFGWTYYYSYPRMAAEGVVMIEGLEIDVEGEVWFDHQWGDFFVVGKPAGWQWFALHLDDGSSLMISEVRGGDGEVMATDGTLVDLDGEQMTLEEDVHGIRLEVLDYWTSPDTAGEYPSRWRLEVESLDLDVTMAPVVADQEVPALPFGNKAAAYWEGRVDVYDTTSGESRGVAFAELSGYVAPEPLSWRNAVR